MTRVLFVIGTRPEAIKISPLVRLFRQRSDYRVTLLDTGQHSSLMPPILESLELRPDIVANIAEPGQSLSSLTSKAIQQLSLKIEALNPDLVFVQGDTTSALGASLAAFFSGVPVAHIEAGLRTHNSQSPFPEEINRQLIARLASLHFTPTEKARENLLDEGVTDASIYVTGNTIVDATIWALDKIGNPNFELKAISSIKNDSISEVIENRNFAIVTMHRRENAGQIFESALGSIARLASEYLDFHWVFPVHPNPTIKDLASTRLTGYPNVHLVDPMDYLSFLYVLTRSKFVLSDSGGIQEESVTLGKTTFLLRANTERPEGVSSGHVELLSLNQETMVEAVRHAIASQSTNSGFSLNLSDNPFGDGTAAHQIFEISEKFLLEQKFEV